MELKKYEQQLENAETTRSQALTELEKAKITVDELTHRLKEINKSKELAIKATKEAKSKTAGLESSGTITDSSLKKELDCAREQYVVAFADLDAAKQELRKLKKDFETSLETKLSAVQQESDAKQLSEVNTERAAQLSQEIVAAQESLLHVKAATEQAQQEELKIQAEKDTARQKYKETLEETKRKIEELKKDSDPAATCEGLEGKLAETNVEIEEVKKKIEEARAADLAAIAAVNNELDDAKEMLHKVSEEETTVRNLVESLRLELEAVKKEHEELKLQDAETEAVIGDLRLKLQKCKAELEGAAAAESKATASSDELLHALEQLSTESKTALQVHFHFIHDFATIEFGSSCIGKFISYCTIQGLINKCRSVYFLVNSFS
jgi:chromosome segregation ATPase